MPPTRQPSGSLVTVSRDRRVSRADAGGSPWSTPSTPAPTPTSPPPTQAATCRPTRCWAWRLPRSCTSRWDASPNIGRLARRVAIESALIAVLRERFPPGSAPVRFGRILDLSARIVAVNPAEA
jgi:hypothetical protein